MADLKKIKHRITSVKATKKVTTAMCMISAAKLRKCEIAARNANPYIKEMVSLCANFLKKDTSCIQKDKYLEKIMAQKASPESGNTVCFIVVTTSRSLCGALNNNVFKEIKNRVSVLQKRQCHCQFICVGCKGYAFIKKTYGKDSIVGNFDFDYIKTTNFRNLFDVGQLLLDLLENTQLSHCFLFYTSFISTLEQRPSEIKLVPLDIQAEHLSILSVSNTNSFEFKKNKNNGNDEDYDKGYDEDNSYLYEKTSPVYDYEPELRGVLEYLIPKTIQTILLKAILENALSEQAARMTSMDSASRNADKMIKNLTVLYNRKRQESITKSLIEIVAGADAVA